MKKLLTLILPLLHLGSLAAGAEFFELPPIHYSKTASNDAMTRLSEDIAKGDWVIPPGSGKEFLRAVLDRLDIPIESQVLVFSKTSLQTRLINEKNPRAIYFSPDAYVAWVPGGKIEVIVEDENLGPVFYLLSAPVNGRPAQVERETDACLQCHATSGTEGVPGLFIRSVNPDENSHAILSLAHNLVDDTTPIQKRWGGWYITGKSGDPHLANRTTTEDVGLAPEHSSLMELSEKFDTEKYLTPTSDIVAIMILEHQCRIHNLLTKAKFGHKRAHFYHNAIQKDLPLTDKTGMTWKQADHVSDEILDALLFKGETEMGGTGVEGSPQFVKAFTQKGIVSKKGKTLRTLRLYSRLFKYRCSYMIHSKAFKSLPKIVKNRVITKLKAALSEEGLPRYSYLSKREKKTITAILTDTVKSYQE